MIFQLIFQIFISLFIIYLIHSFYNYIKQTYSTKKTKDVVQFQTKKYQKILEELQNAQQPYTTNEHELIDLVQQLSIE